MNAITRIPLVTDTVEGTLLVVDGVPRVDSRVIAGRFGKRHNDVLRSIKVLIDREPDLALRSFAQGSYTVAETGEQRHPCYYVDRDGFSLLAMGFTGERALRWKISYIAAFNAMEEELRSRSARPVAIDVRDHGQLATIATQLLQLTQEMKSRAEAAEATVVVQSKQLAIAAPKVEVFDTFMATGKAENLRTVGRLLGAGHTEFFDWMKRKKYIFLDSGWLQPRADLRKAKYLVPRKYETEDGRTGQQTVATVAGQTWLAHRWQAHKRILAMKAVAEAQEATGTLFD